MHSDLCSLLPEHGLPSFRALGPYLYRACTTIITRQLSLRPTPIHALHALCPALGLSDLDTRSCPGATCSYRRLLDQAKALHKADGELLDMGAARRTWHRVKSVFREDPRPRHEHGLEGLALDA